MVDNVSGNDIFRSISEDDRILLQVRLIALIKQYAMFGFAVSLDERKFQKWFPSGRFLPNAYSMACWQCINAVRSWMQATNDGGPISFYFEAGHKHQGEADRAMHRLFGDTMYDSHKFIKKEYAAAIQAADILAYLHGKHVKDLLSGKDRLRADYQELLSGPDCLAMLNNGDRIYDTQTFKITKPRRVMPFGGKVTGRMPLLSDLGYIL